MYDIIIDVVVDGRALSLEEIPQAVSDRIAALQERRLENEAAAREIEYAGVRYQWSVRPCVYP
jgi:hypothetical protein